MQISFAIVKIKKDNSNRKTGQTPPYLIIYYRTRRFRNKESLNQSDNYTIVNKKTGICRAVEYAKKTI